MPAGSSSCSLFLQFQWPSWVYDYCCLPVWAATCMRKWLSIIVGWTMTCIFSAPLSVDWGTVMHLVTFFVKSLLKCCVSFHLLSCNTHRKLTPIYIYRRIKIWYLLRHALVFYATLNLVWVVWVHSVLDFFWIFRPCNCQLLLFLQFVVFYHAIYISVPY